MRSADSQMVNVVVYSRNLNDFTVPTYRGLDDPFGVISLSEKKRRAFLDNPFAADRFEHAQVIGALDGIAFGGEIAFPIDYQLDGEVARGWSGSTTFVAEPYRKTDFGIDLRDLRKKFTGLTFQTGSNSSQMMVRMLKAYRNTIFFLPRHVMVRKSRSVVEMRLKGLLGKIVSFCADIALWFYWLMMGLLRRMASPSLQFKKIDVSDEQGIAEAAQIIALDTHRFQELHDVRWLRWMMTESFENEPMELTLVYKRKMPVAFYMTKKRFHEQASARGFKNVWLGSIMEWGAVPGHESVLRWCILYAACSMRDMDAIEFASDDERLQSFVRHLGWRHVGENNFNFKAWKGSPFADNADMKIQSNWRLRPAMTDGGLN